MLQLRLEWCLFWGWRELGWIPTLIPLTIFTCNYFCCDKQLQSNLTEGTRGEKHLSFQVQWSEGLWLTTNVFTARRQGPAEEARHLLWERNEWIMLGSRGRQTQAFVKAEKSAIYTGFKVYPSLLCPFLKELEVLLWYLERHNCKSIFFGFY